MKFQNVEIRGDRPPVIVCELSGNHNRDLERAFRVIDAIKEAGAKVLKLQTYTADSITLPVSTGNFRINDAGSLWNGRTLHSLYEEAHTPAEWHAPIIDYARASGLDWFSAVFDVGTVEFLFSLDIPVFKLASQEIVHLPLVREVALTGKPIIMSTGMASLSDIDRAVNEFRRFSSAPFALMKCTSKYPAAPDDVNASTIPVLRSLFSCEVGFSDHTIGIGSALASVALGASFVEKHVTLKRSDGGVDDQFSTEPSELKSLVAESRSAWLATGEVKFGPTESEMPSLTGRPSIYVCKDVSKGQVVSSDSIRIVRPSGGLMPSEFEKVLGLTFSRSIRAGEPLDWKDVK